MPCPGVNVFWGSRSSFSATNNGQRAPKCSAQSTCDMATLPIALWPGMKVGQLCFFRLSSAAEFPYGSTHSGSRYQGQRGPTASRSFQNFHCTEV